jgi:hypothetical protein
MQKYLIPLACLFALFVLLFAFQYRHFFLRTIKGAFSKKKKDKVETDMHAKYTSGPTKDYQDPMTPK